MNTVVNLRDFDVFVKDIGGDRDSAKLFDVQVEVDIDYDFAVSDPFSDEYRAQVMRLYSRISAREYSLENERSYVDIQEGIRNPHPYRTKSASVVGKALQSLGHLIDASDVRTGERVVEFGVGWGNTTMAMAMLGAEVTAVDIEDNFLKIIQGRAAQAGVSVKTVLGDFEAVDDLPGRFDVAVFYESFHHAHNHAQFLGKLIDKLKPGARIIFGSEPIYEDFWAPWGVRLDGLSVFCARTFGWLELGFKVSYFRDLCYRYGFELDLRHQVGLDGPLGLVWVATRQNLHVKWAQALLTQQHLIEQRDALEAKLQQAEQQLSELQVAPRDGRRIPIARVEGA